MDSITLRECLSQVFSGTNINKFYVVGSDEYHKIKLQNLPVAVISNVQKIEEPGNH
jgi:hypothetical protein